MTIRRRDFITLLGGAVAWPLAARAQEPEPPVIGFLHPASADAFARFLVAYRQGLTETGYVEGRDVLIEYRWAEGHYDRLPAQAADLVERKVGVIAAVGGNVSALAAKQATSSIPILFINGLDPVKEGLVTSLNRPGGNATGVYLFTTILEPKKLELLCQLVPRPSAVGLLINPNNLTTPTIERAVATAAQTLRRQIYPVSANNEAEIDAAFARFVGQGVGAVQVASDPIFFSRREQLVSLTARHAMPAVFEWRDFAVAGGLMSYGTDLADSYRLMGVYTGRILKGEKPADLPVQQPTKFELVINMKTAKTLGVEVPANLLAIADEVIE